MAEVLDRLILRSVGGRVSIRNTAYEQRSSHVSRSGDENVEGHTGLCVDQKYRNFRLPGKSVLWPPNGIENREDASRNSKLTVRMSRRSCYL